MWHVIWTGARYRFFFLCCIIAQITGSMKIGICICNLVGRIFQSQLHISTLSHDTNHFGVEGVRNVWVSSTCTAFFDIVHRWNGFNNWKWKFIIAHTHTHPYMTAHIALGLSNNVELQLLRRRNGNNNDNSRSSAYRSKCLFCLYRSR